MTDYKNLKLIATSNPHIRGSETTLLPRFLYYTQCADFGPDRYRNSLEMETS